MGGNRKESFILVFVFIFDLPLPICRTYPAVAMPPRKLQTPIFQAISACPRNSA